MTLDELVNLLNVCDKEIKCNWKKKVAMSDFDNVTLTNSDKIQFESNEMNNYIHKYILPVLDGDAYSQLWYDISEAPILFDDNPTYSKYNNRERRLLAKMALIINAHLNATC